MLGSEWSNISLFSVGDFAYSGNDSFTKVNFTYPEATATIKVGTGVKSEGELVASGTEGYVYVPAPWWKTDYFELRYEYAENKKRKFYQLDGDGIRYELVEFANATHGRGDDFYVGRDVTRGIMRIMHEYDSWREM